MKPSNSISTPVLVVGGGVAGLSAALELSRRNLASLICEKDSVLGGRVSRFCCKAGDACARCGACRLWDLLSQVRARREIAVLTRAAPTGAEKTLHGWRVELSSANGESQNSGVLANPLAQDARVEVQAVILAAGYQPFNPQLKTRFAFGRTPGVISAIKLEEMLKKEAFPESASRIAFIQCVGSRDESLGNLYCSRVCCGYALRMARLIRHHKPASRITFFHMDVQGYGRAWEAELPSLRAEMDFVRAMPGEVVPGPGGPQVVFGGAGGSPESQEFDLVVLSTGMIPATDAEALAEMFDVGRDEDGFLAPGGGNVFVAGTAGGPRSIIESIDHGALAASRAMLSLRPAEKEAPHA